MLKEKIPVTVLGATSVIGQRLVRRLGTHPWFRVQHLSASNRNIGKLYRHTNVWRLEGPEYGGLGDMALSGSDPERAFSPIVFSALEPEVARQCEPEFAKAGSLVISCANAFRMEEDVPLVIPEVNPEHLGLLEVQRKKRGFKGGILCHPNCAASILSLALAGIHSAYNVEGVSVATLQAASGAGFPGVASLDLMGNVLPHISGEEQKIEQETQKLLGKWESHSVRRASIPISAQCHRVDVVDGHLEAISVKLTHPPTPKALENHFAQWESPHAVLKLLPSRPAKPLFVHRTLGRPQPRLDATMDGGMFVHVGGIRPCSLLDLKFTLLGHNLERGSAGGAILNAELAVASGWVMT